MGKYLIKYTDAALNDLRKHKKVGNPATLKKITKLISELEEHPFTGTGQPEPLKHELKGLWSRRINQKDRLIYEVLDHIVTVEVVSALGHYGDK
jgi:toxin YoeB